MSDSMWPHWRQPTRLPHPWDSPGKNIWVGWVIMKCFQLSVEWRRLGMIQKKQERWPYSPWIFSGRTDTETLIFGHLMWRADSLEKTLMLGRIEGRRRRGWQDEMAGWWHHRLKWHEFEQTPGDSEGQGKLACFSPWGCKELDMT